MPVYGKEYTAFGKTQRLSDWSRESGIELHTIKYRIHKYGWSVERAVTEKPKIRKARIPYRGKNLSYADLSRISPVGVRAGTIRSRMVDSHMSVQDAITTPAITKAHCTSIRKDRKPDGCIYPNCDNCPFNDCICP